MKALPSQAEIYCNPEIPKQQRHDGHEPNLLLNPEFHWLHQIMTTTVLDFFLDAIAKAKKLICEYIAQNLEQDLLTRRLFSFANGG